MDSLPEFERAMDGLKCEILEDIIQFLIQWQTIKVLISLHVHYESANPKENFQRYFEADLKAPFNTFSILNEARDVNSYKHIMNKIT